jgi:hypothetical protein
MTRPPQTIDIQEKNLSCWDDFENEIQQLPKALQSWERPPLFRGQGNSCFALETTLDRCKQNLNTFKDYYLLITRAKPQIESFTQNVWSIPDFSEVDTLVKNYDAFDMQMSFGKRIAYEFMAYLRHHGFPSPLLDWTRSPYIAAFFAFRNARCEEVDKVSIYALSEKPFRLSGNRMPLVFRLGPYIKAHRRHHLQQCDYTMCLRFDDEWTFENYTEAFSGHGSQGVLRKFNIPSSERTKVLRYLEMHNINAFSLFDSEDSLAETIALREIQLRKNYLESATEEES